MTEYSIDKNSLLYQFYVLQRISKATANLILRPKIYVQKDYPIESNAIVACNDMGTGLC
ncbi:hypothetical protein JCM17724A_20820 [Prevotella fusca JCM 17724]